MNRTTTRSSRSRPAGFGVALVALAAAAGLLVPVIAHPAPAAAAPVDDLQAQARDLEARIHTNAEKLSALNEQIHSAQNDLAQANAEIADADALTAAAQARTAKLRHEVAQRAAALYRQSGSRDGGVLDTDSAQHLAASEHYTARAAQQDKKIVDELARSKEQLAARKADAEQARAVAHQQEQAVQAKQSELAAGDVELQALYGQVKGEIATLVAQAELERQARDAAAAAALYKLPAPAPAPPSEGAGASTGTSSVGPPPAPSVGVGAVLAYAYAQLGKPYCYAGSGPACFDCSGLSMMAWAQAGVAMSHGSYDQQASFPAVSMSALQLGDLVFWDGHVGIYVGDGQVLHAPHSGTVVQITSIWPGVIGASRPG